MVTGLNHLTLSVSELERSVAFYSQLLGFEVRMRGAGSAYLEAGTLWLALVQDETARADALPEYSHAAFHVDESELPLAKERLIRAGVRRWQEAKRDDSFYFLDPDGHKLELHSGDLRSRLMARCGASK
jgi:glutathione S-transferase fosA5